MYLPQDAVIAKEKLTQYLLVLLSKDDKSKFLAQAGYDLTNWQQLEQDIRTQLLSQSAEFLETTRHGDKYCIRNKLRGVNGIELSVLTVWMVTNGAAKFVTLVPDKGAS